MNIRLLPPWNCPTPDFWKGYTVERHQNDELQDPFASPYMIRKGDKNWLLVRNKVNSVMLFPIPESIGNGDLKIKGFEWFKETIVGDTINLTPC